MKPIQLAIILIFIFLFCRFSYADGVYMPEVREKIPDIPVQRAIVKYLNGVETLIVESTFDGEGNNFGWIIPVPNEPSKLEKFSPGLLKTLSLQVQPEIRQKGRTLRVFRMRLEHFFLISIGLICFFTIYRGWKVGIYLWGLTIAAYLIGTQLSMVYRDGAGPSGSWVDPVEIRSTQTIGDYEIFVLKAAESEDLNNWLGDNGFRLFPEKALATIDDYLEKSWYFVAAKLTREIDGISAPHPLLIEFETDRPVYPMRLTAYQNAAVNLELFVIAEAQAVPKGYRLKDEFCNTFSYGQLSSRYYWNTGEEVYGFEGSRYFGRNMGIGHSGARKIMWEGCVLTKLKGRIRHNVMKKDLFIKFKDPAPHRAVSYTHEAALDLVFLFGIVAFMIGFPVWAGWAPKTVEKLLLLPLICILIMFSYYILLGKKVETVKIESEWYSFIADADHALSTIELEEDATDMELINHFSEVEGLENPFTGKAVVLEDSPGNITVIRKYGRIAGLNIYQINGAPKRLIYYDFIPTLEIEELVYALEDEDPVVRMRSAIELGESNQPEIVPFLEAALQDQDESVRNSVELAITKITKKPQHSPQLAHALKDNNKEEQ